MFSPERQYAEHAAVAIEAMGMPRSWGKVLGWLLICDPPQQSSAELADALDLSAGSVSSATRMLVNAGLLRRVAAPGRRGKVYEMTDDAFIRAARSDQFTRFRELMEDGLALVGDETAPRAQRARRARDLYAFLEREVPKLFERFESEHGEGDGNG
jgi:DNA-binding transcriptional regulator GbsR (MarR family)